LEGPFKNFSEGNTTTKPFLPSECMKQDKKSIILLLKMYKIAAKSYALCVMGKNA
jgi:hypothetical protein